MMRKIVLSAVMALFVATSAAWSGEHPSEHPSEKSSGTEHPKGQEKIKGEEHPKGHKKSRKHSRGKISIKDLSKAIKGYVKDDAALKGGYFLVYDPVAKETLQLTLDKVHKDRLAKVGDGVYFVCADFKTPEGKVYDLDIFMKGHHADSLMTTEVSVHKVDGKARYGWVEKKGIWRKK